MWERFRTSGLAGSYLDELTGLFSGLKRSMMEGRIKDEAAVAMGAMRDRLERPGPRR